MKIGFDISALSLPRSGIGRYQYQLLKALLKLDPENFYHLFAFNFRNRERFDGLFEGENVKMDIKAIPQRLITLWWMMASFPSLEQLGIDCDIIQLSEIAVQPVRKARTVAFVHDLTTQLFPDYHVWSNRFLHNRRFQHLDRVDAVLTNSEATKRDIVEYLKIEPRKVHVTALAADEQFRVLDSFKVLPVLEKYGLKKPYLLFVGTLEPRKNVETLIKAFNLLKERHRIPHQLVLAGQKGWLYERILELIKFSPYREDIKQIGYVPDTELPAILNGAEVFVYPSYYEGFGLPVLEAMQCGTPVITSDVSSLPEVGGEACLYTSPDSTEQLADQIYRVISSSSLQKSLSEAGKERAKAFSWEKCARETLGVYKNLA